MHTWLVLKYVNLISYRLENYTLKNNTPNFKCPFCGDSKRNRFKARGYLYETKGSYSYKCHNCGVQYGFEEFLQKLDYNLYDEYKLELFAEKYNRKPVEKINDSTFSTHIPDFKSVKLVLISDLPDTHPAKQYIIHRKIPDKYYRKLQYCANFAALAQKADPDRFTNLVKEPRLIIPLRDENGKFFGFQGRAFGASDLKYITIMIDKSKPKIFGLDTVDVSKETYVLEGPIDSMFIENSIAMVGADFSAHENLLIKEKTTVIYDNEPRNVDIINRISKCISRGYKVVLWPKYMNHKDINEMIMAGYTQNDILKIIKDNTHSGLIAQYILNDWKRI
jgi:transposase-like protein